ncbi:hypothetical protein [Kitasatospora griseola]|uniref:hypothetical protein n=1 Tax=Kitasatospora griseola TaxID=2064 RepID=UPI00364BFBA4
MADYRPAYCPSCWRPYQTKRDGTLRVHWKGQRPKAGGPITNPCPGSNEPPGGEWTVTAQNVYRLWDQEIIAGPCKPHYSWSDTTDRFDIDGLTIKDHLGQPQQVAYIGDTIRLDHDGRYTVHLAAAEQQAGVR